jgi:Uma2 family endonuclease
MADIKIHPSHDHDSRNGTQSDGQIDFESWLARSLASDRSEPETELRQGVVIRRMSAQYPHEWIFAWLFKISGSFVSNRNLGVVLGSRSAVKITDYDGRLPDLLFVREENRQIIRTNAIYGAPDLVFEIVSANDRPKGVADLESDYKSIGIREIVMIDPKRKRVRVFTKTGIGYGEALLTTGRLELACVPGFWIEVEWLFADKKPDEFTHTKRLIDAAEDQHEVGD